MENEKRTRIFHPIFEKIYFEAEAAIKIRIFEEVVSSFNRCPFTLLEKLTGIKEGEALVLAKNNPQLPILQDPITQSLVYNRNMLPLYKEVAKLYQRLNERYRTELGDALRAAQEEGGIKRLGNLMRGFN